jgi:hypothetical protein
MQLCNIADYLIYEFDETLINTLVEQYNPNLYDQNELKIFDNINNCKIKKSCLIKMIKTKLEESRVHMNSASLFENKFIECLKSCLLFHDVKFDDIKLYSKNNKILGISIITGKFYRAYVADPINSDKIFEMIVNVAIQFIFENNFNYMLLQNY